MLVVSFIYFYLWTTLSCIKDIGHPTTSPVNLPFTSISASFCRSTSFFSCFSHIASTSYFGVSPG